MLKKLNRARLLSGPAGSVGFQPHGRGGSKEKATTPAALEKVRAAKMREIALLRHANSDPKSFAAKAEALLTRHWGRSTYRQRQSILATVVWLLRREIVDESREGVGKNIQP
jgi:hypothetical protein